MMTDDEPKTGGKLLEILSERISCLERIQAAQHAELTKLFAGIRALQAALDSMTSAGSAPKN